MRICSPIDEIALREVSHSPHVLVRQERAFLPVNDELSLLAIIPTTFSHSTVRLQYLPSNGVRRPATCTCFVEALVSRLLLLALVCIYLFHLRQHGRTAAATTCGSQVER